MELTRTVNKKSLTAYAELLKRVREAVRAGKERAFAAVERESVRTKWEVGKLIHEHILLNQSRAEYDKQVLERLSRDIGVSGRELRYMVEFARTYPIWPVPAKLSWAHIRDLLAVNDPAERKQIAEEAGRGKWTQEALRREIKRLKAAKKISVSKAPAEEPLVPQKGKLDTYRIITGKIGPWAGQLALDLGFANYRALDSGQAKKFKDRDIIEIASPRSAGLAMTAVKTMTVVKGATEKDLFTYRAYLLQVTDADTLWCLIDLGFGFITQQQLRLRGLDAPEITSRAGQGAKRFVESELKKASSIVITTTRSDKYDRYLADVFYTVNSKEFFLNNRLLEAGLASRTE